MADKEKLAKHINTAYAAILDAQLALLAHATSPVYEWELEQKLGTELSGIYRKLETIGNSLCDVGESISHLGTNENNSK